MSGSGVRRKGAPNRRRLKGRQDQGARPGAAWDHGEGGLHRLDEDQAGEGRPEPRADLFEGLGPGGHPGDRRRIEGAGPAHGRQVRFVQQTLQLSTAEGPAMAERRRLGVAPETNSGVLCFEDSLSGAEAALRAGMHCICLPEPRLDPEPFQRLLARHEGRGEICRSLREVDWASFEFRQES